jgi:hypothetical protein
MTNQEVAMRWITVLLILLMAFPASSFADAKQPRGNKAAVYHAGSKYRGTLLYVDGELTVLKEKKTEELLGFSTPQVEKIYIRKSKAGIGILTGLAVGAGLIGVVLLATPKKGNSLGDALGALFVGIAIIGGLILTVFLAVGGGLLGSLFGWKRFKLYKMDAAEKEKALQKLQVYALFGTLPEELRSRLVMVGK